MLDHGRLGVENWGGSDSYRSPPRACREYCLQKRGAEETSGPHKVKEWLRKETRKHQYPTTKKCASEEA
jgi:hypothetical protein